MIEIEKIYNIYFKDVYYFILSISKNEQIAEEITSETFFKFLNAKNLENVNSIKSYLFKIAKNCFLDYLRRNNFEKIDIESIELPSDDLNPQEEFLKTESEIELRLALSKLDEVDEMVVKLRAFEDLSFSDIGKIFGKSENWACVKFHRAKDKLKKYLEEYYE